MSLLSIRVPHDSVISRKLRVEDTRFTQKKVFVFKSNHVHTSHFLMNFYRDVYNKYYSNLLWR